MSLLNHVQRLKVGRERFAAAGPGAEPPSVIGLWVALYIGAGGAPVCARSPEPSLAVAVIGAIAVLSLLAGVVVLRGAAE